MDSLSAMRPAARAAGRLVVDALLARLLVAWLVIVVGFAVTTPNFFQVHNFLNIGRASAIFGMASLGMTVALIGGALDVSVGAVMSAAGIVAAERLAAGDSLGVALAAGVGVGVLLGGANGLLVAVSRLDPLIITLGTLSLIGAWTYVHNTGLPIAIASHDFLQIGIGQTVGIPNLVWMVAGVAIGLALALRFTTFGQRLYVSGDNPRAAGLSGVHVIRIRVVALTISGGTAGLAGVMLAANLGRGQAGHGEPFLLSALAAVVIGGTSLSGGVGTIAGTLVGVALLGTINNGLNLNNVPSYWQSVLAAAILLGALILDRIRRSQR